MDIAPLWRYILARQEILIKRKSGQPPPWTDDKILSRYSFCNVYREDDRTTVWCKKHVRDKYKDAPMHILALAIAVFRNFNRIKTGEAIFNTPAFEKFIHEGDIKDLREAILKSGAPYFTGAYIIRSENGYSKLDGVLKYLPTIAGVLQREIFNPVPPTSCQQVFDRLMGIPYIGTFMAAQLIADMKYTKLLEDATDWFTFAASGPGSRRGMNIVLNKDPDTRWNEEDWHDNVIGLHFYLVPKFRDMGWTIPHAQDVQNNLCEFAKYTRGSSRNKYIPGGKK